MTDANVDKSLDYLWSANAAFVRQRLIAMTRDIDLAEDLLQETYVCAYKGFDDYRGGNPRAWLAAIARNTCVSHFRRRSSAEVPIETEFRGDLDDYPGSSDHIEAIRVREALSALTPALRLAVTMKHCWGLTYEEIGHKLSCTESTARQHVWRGMRRLRDALSDRYGNALEATCSQMCGSVIIDYLCHALPDPESEKARWHIWQCDSCKMVVRDLGRLMNELSGAEFITTRVIDIDEDGVPTEYNWWSAKNNSNMPRETSGFTANKDIGIDLVMFQGEEVVLERTSYSETQYEYEARLPHPVNPGDSCECALVTHPLNGAYMAHKLPKGIWQFPHLTTPNSQIEWLFVLMVRLPEGAKLVTCDPKPERITAVHGPSLLWRTVLPIVTRNPDGSFPWQFQCIVEYEYPDAKNHK